MGEAEIDQDLQIEYDLENAMVERIQLRQSISQDEKRLKEVDNNIKLAMIGAGMERYKNQDLGHSFKIATGTNSNISEKTVRDYLSRVWELDPDQIDEFLKAVTKKTKYDYVDMRKLEDKDGV